MKVSGFRFQVSALVAALFCVSASAAGAVAHWQILPEKSAIEWTAIYGGKPVAGSFPAFAADIAFDADHVDASRATIKIEMAKVKSDDKDAQENLPGSDWFAVVQYPLAVFESTGFTHVKDNQYQLEGNLTVRGKTVKVTLPFTARFYDDADASVPVHYARVEGETVVKRTALGVGQGDWSQTDSIADDVKIAIRLEAKQVP